VVLIRLIPSLVYPPGRGISLGGCFLFWFIIVSRAFIPIISDQDFVVDDSDRNHLEDCYQPDFFEKYRTFAGVGLIGSALLIGTFANAASVPADVQKAVDTAGLTVDVLGDVVYKGFLMALTPFAIYTSFKYLRTVMR